MKVIITGSLGHISKPLTEELIQNGIDTTVISSDPSKKHLIDSLGATAAIGSLEDVDFLTKTFTGADVVYCMIPPNNYFDQSLDLRAYYQRLGNNYANAIKQSGVKRVINLSTIGAHLAQGSGMLIGAHDVQNIFNELPSSISIIHLRPTSFFYNLYGYVEIIKNTGNIAANYGADRMIPWVSPLDIADAICQEILTPFTGRKIRYVASEELTGHETAEILGQAIGKPNLHWTLISNEETLQQLATIGMNKQIAAGLVEMYSALYTGLLSEDYVRNRPAIMGKIKLREFAKEFAKSF